MKIENRVKYNHCLKELYKMFHYGKGNPRKKFIELGKTLGTAHGNMLVGFKLASIIFHDKSNEAKHIFLETEDLYDFLVNTEIKNLNYIKKYIKDNCNYAVYFNNNHLQGWNIEFFERDEGTFEEVRKKLSDVIKDENITFDIYKELVICVHIPNYKDDCSMIISLDEEDNLFCGYVLGEGTTYLPMIKKPKDIHEANIKEVSVVTNLVFNLIGYMGTYPDKVKNELPKGFCFKNASGSKKMIISESETVKEHIKRKRSGEKVVAHFRSGYFRYLSSDFFTKKKGQWVYVKETIVNKKQAQTVED